MWYLLKIPQALLSQAGEKIKKMYKYLFSSIGVILIFIIVTFLTFSNTFENKFVWDDDYFFASNIYVKTFDFKRIFTSNTVAGAGVATDYYRPITSLAFALDYKLYENKVFGYHLTNIYLHALTAIFLYLFLLKIKVSRVVSFWITIIFVVHPVQVEAVTYLSSRGDILYSLFVLVSLWFFAQTLYKKQSKIRVGNFLFLFLALVFFTLSLFAKEVALGTSPLFVATLLLFKYQKKLTFKSLHQKYKVQVITTGLVIWISLLYMILRLYVLNFNNSLNFTLLDNPYTSSILVRLMTFLKIIWLYLGMLFYPFNLYLERDTSIETSFLNLPVFSGFVLILSLVFLVFWEIRKRKSFWLGFFLIWVVSHLTPVSGIVPMTYLYHENWLYMPMIGILLFLYFTFKMFFPKLKLEKINWGIWRSLTLVTFFLAYLTYQQNKVWKDPVYLFSHNLKYNNNARINLNLGNAYLAKGDLDNGVYYLQEAKRLSPSMPQTYYNLGVTYQLKNDKQQAKNEYLQALKVDPNYLYVYPLIVNLYIEEKAYDKALPYIERLNKIYINDLKFVMIYSNLLFKSGKFTEAEEQFQKALKISKNDSKVLEKINQIKAGKSEI